MEVCTLLLRYIHPSPLFFLDTNGGILDILSGADSVTIELTLQ